MKVKYIGKVTFNVDSKVLTPNEVYDISEKSVKIFHMLFEEVKPTSTPKQNTEPSTDPEVGPETKPKQRAKASK